MFFFPQNHSTCLKTEEAKKIVRAYNRIAKVLVEYEILFHTAWVKSVEVATQCKFLYDWPYHLYRVKHNETKFNTFFNNCDSSKPSAYICMAYLHRISLPLNYNEIYLHCELIVQFFSGTTGGRISSISLCL